MGEDRTTANFKYCPHCGAKVMTKAFEPYVKQAIEAWNRRVNYG